MSLQFVMGNSGFGKTKYLYEHIIKESIDNPDKKYFILVPEQFTMQTQKDFALMHPHRGIFNIDVLSFQRLAYRVFEEQGANNRTVLEEAGKSMVIRKIAGTKEDKLHVLGKNLKKMGYIGEIKSLISELTQYAVSPLQLQKMAKRLSDRPLLSYKLMDMGVLYEAFLDYMGTEYITSDQILDVLGGMVSSSKLLKGSVIILDGFTAFNTVQNHLIQTLLMSAEKIYVTATIEYTADVYTPLVKTDLFYLPKKMIQNITGLAKEAGVMIEEPVVCGRSGKNRFHDCKELEYLEKSIFRPGSKPYEDNADKIGISYMHTPEEEIKGTARTIRRLIRTENYHYSDIAVILGDSKGYFEHVRRIFAMYEIPCFIDQKQSILNHPFIEWIRSLLSMIEDNFTYESVMRYLRSPFSGFSKDMVDRVENYILALGIVGRKRYESKWVRFQNGQTEEELKILQEFQTEFNNQIMCLCKDMTPKNSILYKSKQLYAFFEQESIQLKLKNMSLEKEKEGDMVAAKQYDQIYGALLGLMDKMAAILGDELVNLEGYIELLEAGIPEIGVGTIPPVNDQVLVGDLERTRIKDVKLLFLLGACEGNIPKGHMKGGILSELERGILEEEQIELAPSAREQAYYQKFYLYFMLTKAEDRLYISCPLSGFKGETLRPSYLMTVIYELFPRAYISYLKEDDISNLETPKEGLDYFISRALQDNEEIRKQIAGIAKWYQEEGISKDNFEKVWSYRMGNLYQTSIGELTARAIYGNNPVYSVTRLERYAACAYAHFLQYGLRLREREQYELQAVDLGTLLHHTVELFCQNVEKSKYDWFSIPQDYIDNTADSCVKEAIADYRNTILYSTARNEAVILRLDRIAKRTIWAMIKQLKNGFFTPKGQEEEFKLEIEGVSLQGRIDRIDSFIQDGKAYIRVLDYKSGSTGFDMTAVYNGLSLQLGIYLNAAVITEKERAKNLQVVPAGLFYFHMDDPVIETTKELTSEELEQKLLKEMAWDGLVNDDPQIIKSMGDLINVSYNKDGTLRKTDKTMSNDQMIELMDYVLKKAGSLGEEIMEGHVEVNPYERGKKTACDYCSYRGVCEFDPTQNMYRQLEKSQWE